MRLIDADALKEKIDDIWNGRPLSFLGARLLAMIDSAPTIDIVRCKECKNCRVEGNTTRFYWCHYWNKPTDLERYCSDGEREGE